ncbi:MAG: TetR/AcrR family transcriptional regulator [Clostridiales bacterium]|nr:TetR/AcrR family transcriptional regulator [Candidatus Blautia equi]
MSTRDRIAEAALELFSEKGYDGTGVDEIGETVGIKGPSIYRHYRGKEDILYTLIEQFEDYYDEHYGQELTEEDIPSSLDELVEMTMERVNDMIHDPFAGKMRRMIAQEQFRNEDLKEQMARQELAGMENLYTEIFASMMDEGLLTEEDPRLLAFQFVSPITLMIHLCDRNPELEDAALNRIRMHMELFANTFGA